MATPLRTHTHEWNTQTHSGKRRRILTALITLLALVLPSSVAFGQAPPGPTTLYKSTLEVLNPPAQFDLIQLGLEFKPGAWTPHHSHGGQALITVLDGAMTRHTQDAETTYKAGESWVEAPGEVHAAGNTTATTAHVQVSFILPKGAVLTTVQQVAPSAPAALPKTGGSVDRALYLWVALLAVGGLIASGWVIWRMRGRAA